MYTLFFLLHQIDNNYLTVCQNHVFKDNLGFRDHGLHLTPSEETMEQGLSLARGECW